MSPQQQAEEIRNRMAQIRCDLEDDVDGVVKSARTMTDWHYYVRTYPWWCLGSAAVAGYFMVPRSAKSKHPEDRLPSRLAKGKQYFVGRKDESQEEEAHQKTGMKAALFGMLGNLILRSAVAYLGQQATRYWQRSMMSPSEQTHGIGPDVRSQ